MKTYTCTVCGKTDQWDAEWSRYSSIDLDETCPNDVPVCCSLECAAVAKVKISKGEWKLPELSHANGYYSTVVKERQGY